jgi:amidohydrolase
MLPAHSPYRKTVQKEVDRLESDIIRISRTIHAHPEIGLAEHQACTLLTSEARRQGFEIQTPVAGMDTAFIGRYASPIPGPCIAFCCEYDALPELGHACGHNVIAAASFGAALAVRPIVEELGGSVLLIGTPDEEAIGEVSKGGKVVMCRAGVFDSVDAAFMMHPTGGKNAVWRYAFPLTDFTVAFTGKPAHYTQPEKGINALDSLLMLLSNLNALKRGWNPSVMLAYTITDGGGPSAITVPKSAAAHFSLKAFDAEYMESRLKQVTGCVEAVARMTGAAGRLEILDQYRHMIPNLHLAAALLANIRSLDAPVENPLDSQRNLERQRYPGISTDFSDVSWVTPAIHGYCSLGDENLIAHTPEFAAAAGSNPGDEAAVFSATVMALTAVDLLADAAFTNRMKTEFLEYRQRNFRNVPGIPPGFILFPGEFQSVCGA